MINSFKKLVIPAPLSGITNEPFRICLKNLSAKITFTEMISAEGVVRHQEKTLNMLKIKKEQPVVIPQLFGSSPDILFKAAQILVKEGFEYVDINMGCPVKKVIKKGAGVKLMENPKTVYEIISRLKTLPIKISAKIRLGTTKQNINYLEITKILYNEGINMITLHPRTGDEFFKNHAKWEYIKILKEKFPDLFIVGNGDIKTPEHIKSMFDITNCDSVMVGRKICENPFLIKQWEQFFKFNSYFNYGFYERIKLFKTLFYLLKEFYNEKISLNLAKKYLIFFTKGMPSSNSFRKKLSKIKNCVEILEEISYWENSIKR